MGDRTDNMVEISIVYIFINNVIKKIIFINNTHTSQLNETPFIKEKT